jgi:hypothetical protein
MRGSCRLSVVSVSGDTRINDIQFSISFLEDKSNLLTEEKDDRL